MFRRLILMTALVAIPAAAAAQPVQVPGTIRSGVTLVPVDVRVLDKNGQPITDLTEQDFTLLENGIPQQIRQFQRQALTAEAQTAAAPDMQAVADGMPGPQKHRTFLIVLGRGRLQHPSRGVDAMVRFVREQVLPQDRVAVMAWNRATDFTTDHAAIAGVLERFRREHESIEARLHFAQSGLAGIYGGKAIPARTQAQIDAVFAGRIDFRTVPPGRVTDAGRIAEDSRSVTNQLMGDIVSSSARPAGSDMSLDEHLDASNQTSSDLENIYTGIEYMRYIDGEKRLVFVTQRGLFLPRLEDDMSLAAMANDARVVLDTVQTGGIGSGPPRSGRPSTIPPGPTFTETFALQSLRTMSALSGGVSSIYAYADEAMDRIDRSSRFQYLLAYAPTDPDMDGRYRRISVQVNRPGATLHYRRGYYARAQLVPYDRREFLTYSRVMAAALYPQPILDIRLRLRTRTERLDDGIETVADVRIDLNRIRFDRRADGLLHAQLDVSLYTANANGRGIGEMYRKLNLAYTPEEHQRMLKEGLNYTLRLRTGVKPRMVKVVVYDYAGDVIGTAESQVY